MRTELTQLEKIERYIENQMSASDKLAFEQELSENPDLQVQLEQMQLLKRAVIRQAIKKDIQQFAPKAKFKFAKWTVVLGSVCLLLGLAYFFAQENSTSETSAQDNLVSTELDEEPKKSADLPLLDKIDSTATLISLKSTAPKLPAKITNSRPEKFNGLQTWLEPEIQRFTIDTKQGATLEGKDGTLIIVPSDAFVDFNGNVINASVELEVVEALKMSDMIAYNLATVSNGKPLSSGGMLYVQPYANGEKVGVNPNRPLYIEIPTDDYQADMKSWRGVTDENGDINWENPQDLQKFLVRMDLEQLDFLPPGFENTVLANMPFRNHKAADKRLVDSLYYGLFAFEVGKSVRIGEFDCSKNDLEYLFGDYGYVVENKEKYLKEDANTYRQTEKEYNQRIEDLLEKVERKETLTEYEKKCFCLMIERNMVPEKLLNNEKKDPKLNNGKNQGKTSMIPPIKIDSEDKSPPEAKKTEPESGCFIKPTSIKVLKTREFVNTFIATKEFEERLRALHGIAEADSLLDLYVNNLAKNLWEVDALVAQRLQGEERKLFENFAAQRCTNLKDVEIYQERLSNYYASKRDELAAENKKASLLYQKKNAQELEKLSEQLGQMKTKLNQLNEQRATNASQMDVYTRINESTFGTSDNKQIPAFIPKNNDVVRSANVYATTWFESGWMNIDMYLKDINKDAVDMEFVANLSASKPTHFKIYQCINILKSLVSLSINNNKAIAKFPSKNSKEAQAMSDTYAIGLQWKENGTMALAEHKFNPYKTKSIDLLWEEIDSKDLRRRLEKLDHSKALMKHIEKQEELILQAQKIKAETAFMQAQIQQTKQKLEDKQKEILAEIEFMKMLQRSIDVCGKPFLNSQEKEAIVALLDFEPVEIEPGFPGGDQAMVSFIKNNFIIPPDLVLEDPKRKIYIQFFIETDGSISDITVVRGIHPVLDAEAVRVVSIMPKFSPAQNKGVPVRLAINLPISLHLK